MACLLLVVVQGGSRELSGHCCLRAIAAPERSRVPKERESERRKQERE